MVETVQKSPEAKFSVGAVHVAVWKNESKEGNQFSTVSLNRVYKQGDEWKQANSLKESDIPKAILALQKAYEHISLKEQ